MNKDRGLYCKHLERLLPKSSGQSLAAYPTNRVEDLWIRKEFYERTLNDAEVEKILIKFGLDPHEVELVMLRYIDNKSMLEIVKEQGWLDLNSANYHLRKALKRLRQGRFSFNET